MYRKITILIGCALLAFGIFNSISTYRFIRRAIPVSAQMVETDSRQQRKLSYSLPDGQQISSSVTVPSALRLKGNELSILVDPDRPNQPQIAALHILFRAGMGTIFLGLMILFISWLTGLRCSPQPSP